MQPAETTGGPVAEMPRYFCHKNVWALKIARVENNEILHFEDTLFLPINMGFDWCEKHEPQAGGYLVQYEGGYRSYSPAEAFEAGYSPEAVTKSDEPIAQFFGYGHLRPPLREVSRMFAHLASRVLIECPRNAERTVALRKLLEAKDAAVRAALAK